MPSIMVRGSWGTLALAVVVLLGAFAGPAAGDPQETPAPSSAPRVTGGGEVTAVAGPEDDQAFFNYTDYEHNALRVLRVRLLGEWRIWQRLSLLGEARTENGDGVQIPALYLRWQPWRDHNFDVQIGRIPPVIGSFPRRAYGRDNVVVGSPLPYQYLISLRPDALPATIDQLLRMRGRGWQPSYPIGSQALGPGIPVVSSFRWDTGAEASWRNQWMELAGAVTLGAPATPVVQDPSDGQQYSGRIAMHAPGGLTVGLSGARGGWINRSVLNLVPESLRGRHNQTVVGVDAEAGVGPWLVRAEWLHSSFELPFVGETVQPAPLVADSAFVEGRYRFHPRWQIAARVDHLGFSTLVGTINNGAPTTWDAPVERVEGILGFRARRNVEIRGGYQYNWRDGGRVHEQGYPTLMGLFWF
ncbi:MAG TPA: hypothetical protein VLT86_07355 [Vicinamibacterales bacterium]|nr:hypothetical protein [Vicinamibacterales bacterium]